MNIEIYTMKNCSHCKEAKEYLTKHEISFKEIDMSIGGKPEVIAMKRYFKEIGLKTFPVTMVIDKKVVLQGFDEKEFNEVFKNDKT